MIIFVLMAGYDNQARDYFDGMYNKLVIKL
jgi:hypothetical protein